MLLQISRCVFWPRKCCIGVWCTWAWEGCSVCGFWMKCLLLSTVEDVVTFNSVLMIFWTLVCSFLTKDCEGLQLNQVTLAGLPAFPVHGWSSVAGHLHTVFILCVLSEGMTSYLFSSCNFYCCEDFFVCLFLTICVLFWLVLGWHILLHNFTFYLFLLIFKEGTYRQKCWLGCSYLLSTNLAI